jgi:hypothetical protein
VASSTASAPDAERERGSGLVSTSFGFAFFLAFLLLAVHLLVHLHATSVLEAVTEDAVARAARSVPRDQVEAEARDALGAMGAAATFTWSDDGERLVLRVEADGAALGPLERLWGELDAEASVRAEVLR